MTSGKRKDPAWKYCVEETGMEGKGIGNKGIIAVGENCKSLTDLSIRFCDRVGDGALIAIAEGCSLHYLNVSSCHQIGDIGLIAIARGSPQLCYLDVSVLQDDEIDAASKILKALGRSHSPVHKEFANYDEKATT
ncbi:hypothetical protein OROMI_019741 [Orobanche minor]